MGDSGAMTLGFLLAGVSLGTRYSHINNLGVFAPLLILFVPMYDTLFVMYLRLRKGQSPFLGSKDHFALRLEKLGHSRGADRGLLRRGFGLPGLPGFPGDPALRCPAPCASTPRSPSRSSS